MGKQGGRRHQQLALWREKRAVLCAAVRAHGLHTTKLIPQTCRAHYLSRELVTNVKGVGGVKRARATSYPRRGDARQMMSACRGKLARADRRSIVADDEHCRACGEITTPGQIRVKEQPTQLTELFAIDARSRHLWTSCRNAVYHALDFARVVPSFFFFLDYGQSITKVKS